MEYNIMSDYTFTVGSASENCTVTEINGTLYIQLTNKRATGASGTTPGTPTTPTDPADPTAPDIPPVTPDTNLVPNADGSYYEVDENGVALG